MSVYIYSVFVNIIMTTPPCRAVRCLLSSMLKVYSFCNLLFVVLFCNLLYLLLALRYAVPTILFKSLSTGNLNVAAL